MNERIRELAEQALFESDFDDEQNIKITMDIFAELIVKECIEQGKQIQSQTVSNGSKDYSDGRKMGIEVYMNQIQKHFGIKE